MVRHGNKPDWKKYALCQICLAQQHDCAKNFRMSGVIWLVLNQAHQGHKILGAQGILAHQTGETDPKRSGKWPKKQKSQQKLGKLLKRSAKCLKLLKRNFISGRHNKFGAISCALSLVQSCMNSAQQCAKFSASAWEDVWWPWMKILHRYWATSIQYFISNINLFVPPENTIA